MANTGHLECMNAPHLAYSVDNRQHSQSASISAVLTIGTIGIRTIGCMCNRSSSTGQ